MRNFIFTYKKLGKYEPDIEYKGKVTISKSTGDIGFDAKKATELFSKSYGSLKYNDIISIQEIDNEGNPIGEIITPMGDNGIVPVK